MVAVGTCCWQSCQQSKEQPATSAQNRHRRTIVGIKRALDRVTDDGGVQTLKEIVSTIDSRFAEVTKDPTYVAATVVDSRYRGRLVTPTEQQHAMQCLTELA